MLRASRDSRHEFMRLKSLQHKQDSQVPNKHECIISAALIEGGLFIDETFAVVIVASVFADCPGVFPQ